MTNTQQQERIIDCARSLFFKYGIKSVTMDQIAAETGMSKKTLYESFEDKDAIVNSLSVTECKCHLEEMGNFKKNASNAIEEIFLCMSYMSKSFSRINPILFYEMQKLYPKAWKEFRHFKEQIVHDFIVENFKQGVKEGLYREELKIKVLARLRLAEMELAFSTDTFPTDKFDPREVQVILLDHFMHGISTLKGYKLINKIKHIKEEE